MSGPDPRHLETEAKGRAAAKILEAGRDLFAAERRRVERAICRAVDEGRLSADAAIGFCARLDAICRLEHHLGALASAGQAASTRLSAFRSGAVDENL